MSGSATDRNWGVDLLRIVSMLMVPVLHVLGHGGVLEATSPFSLGYELAWLLEIAAYCAVDCFALVSGYVGYQTRHRCRGLVSLCAQASFYLLGATMVCAVVNTSAVGADQLLDVVFPFRGAYWYLKAYFCLFFFMPYLDVLVARLADGQLRGLVAVIVLVLSILPIALHSDLGTTNWGYSLVWLGALYILGAALRRASWVREYANGRNLFVYCACVAVAWGSKLAIELVTSRLFGEPMGGSLLIPYTSPVILACAVALLLFFARLELRGRVVALVRLLAPLSFGVYLLHEEPHVRALLIEGSFAGLVALGPPLMCVGVLASAVGIWLVGSAVDWLRARLFSLLRVDALCCRAGDALDGLLARVSEGRRLVAK